MSAVKPYTLADIGEGITECRIVKWFVKPGDRVSQFDAICEVQSDKASVEITSRYDGVVSGIHHEVDEMAEVGKPLLDIDVDEDLSNVPIDLTYSTTEENVPNDTTSVVSNTSRTVDNPHSAPEIPNSDLRTELKIPIPVAPAVRAMLREHKINIKYVVGTGKGGRVLKEDVQGYLFSKASPSAAPSQSSLNQISEAVNDQVLSLMPIQAQMFKVMTRVLSIPHFGYRHAVDLTSLENLRRRFNEKQQLSNQIHGDSSPKLTILSFILKALSEAFLLHRNLNAHLDTENDPKTPRLIVKGSHNFGIAVDTPNGLVVPVVKDVQNRSVVSIAAETQRLGILAREGCLTPADLSGVTFTVSNIGSIGGSVVSPIIMPPTVAIVAIGKAEKETVLSEGDIARGLPTKRVYKSVLSWTADHRVLDGASVAKCAHLVSQILEDVDIIGLGLR